MIFSPVTLVVEVFAYLLLRNVRLYDSKQGVEDTVSAKSVGINAFALTCLT
jgi:hypothetical protein